MSGSLRSRIGGGAIAAAMAALGIWATPAGATTLPDGRAYELVSPPDTMGQPASSLSGLTAPLSDNQIIYGGGYLPDGPSGSGNEPYYVATRTSTGWTSTSLLPSQISGATQWGLLDVTPSLSAAVFLTDAVDVNSSVPPAAQEVGDDLVYRDASGAFATIQSIPFSDLSQAPQVLGMSADGQFVFYISNVTPQDVTGGPSTAYEWTPGGSPQAIDGAPGDPLDGCGVTPVDQGAPNSVSSDGSTVFVQSLPNGSGTPANCPGQQQVFAIINGHSQQVSVPTNGMADPLGSAAGATFVGASADGRTAYFTTAQPLTSDAGPASSYQQLYRWTAGVDGGGPNVTCVSCAADDAQSGGGQGVGIPEVSSNGQYVYFPMLNPSPNANGSNAQEIEVAQGASVQTVDSDAGGYVMGQASLELSPAGNVVVFSRTVTLPNGTTESPSYRAVVGAGGVSTPQCITCGVAGTAGTAVFGITGDASLPSLDLAGNDAISADGNTVVFETTNGLGTTDAYGGYQVWEWTPSGGDQFIASGDLSGAISDDAVITPDGQNIFFYSRDALTFDADQPGTEALYDARVGGGFAAPEVSSTSCSGSACRAPSPSPSPSPPAVASGLAGSNGNVHPGLAPSATVLAPSAAELRGALRTGRLSVRVSVRGGGRLQVAAVAKLGRSVRRVAKSSRELPDRGDRTVSLTLRFTSMARQQLRKTRQLSLVVNASLPGASPKVRRVLLGTGSHSTRSGGRS